MKRMRMKRIVIFVITACLMTPLHAQKEKTQKEPVSDVTYGVPQPKNPDVNGIMEKAMASIMDPLGVAITYNLRYKDIKGKRANATSGTAKIKGEKFYLFAPEIESWYNGTTQWTLQRGAKEVSISTPTDAELADTNPMFIIRNYKKYYTAKYIRRAFSSDQQRYVHCIELTPKNTKSDIKKIIFNVFDTIFVPYMIVLYHQNEATTHIYMSKFDQQQKMDETTFNFNPADYPGNDIIDLR